MADIESLRQLIRGLDHDLKLSERENRELKKKIAELRRLKKEACEVRISDVSPVQETRGDLLIG